MPPRFFGGGEGFLRSGDLGHYDDKGNLYFDGRIKELIKYKNFHLYPNELVYEDPKEDSASLLSTGVILQQERTLIGSTELDTEMPLIHVPARHSDLRATY